MYQGQISIPPPLPHSNLRLISDPLCELGLWYPNLEISTSVAASGWRLRLMEKSPVSLKGESCCRI